MDIVKQFRTDNNWHLKVYKPPKNLNTTHFTLTKMKLFKPNLEGNEAFPTTIFINNSVVEVPRRGIMNEQNSTKIILTSENRKSQQHIAHAYLHVFWSQFSHHRS